MGYSARHFWFLPIHCQGMTDSGLPPLSTQRSFSVNVFSQPQVSAVTAENDGIKIAISTFAGQEYQLQSSEDLIDWANVGDRIVGTAGSLDLFAPIDPEQSRYFYRIVAQGPSD